MTAANTNHGSTQGNQTLGLPFHRILLYSFLLFTVILVVLLGYRHYDYDQRFHAQDSFLSSSQRYSTSPLDDRLKSGSIFSAITAATSNSHQPKQKIAYIFAGSARSFICPKVHWSLRFNAIDAFGGDPYVFVRISAEDNQNTRTGTGKIWTPQYQQQDIEETLKILNPRKIQYFSLQKQIEEMQKYYPGEAHEVFRENDLRRYSMFFQRCMGYKLALDYEREHGIRFDWVVLIRLDAGWSGPVQPIEYYSKDRVWLTETGYVAYNDQFMLIPRQYSDYLFDLNTKVDRRVYCLGGPDVEVSWKCNATQLAKRGYSQQKINTTLSYCCRDVFTENRLGYSETIHYRHFEYGKIPVGFAHFLVYLTRYTNSQCYADCDRLMYNFKNFLFGVIQKHYPYMARLNSMDSRGAALSLTDTATCYALNHPSGLWQPLAAASLHRIHRQHPHLALDYSKSLYAQLPKMPRELIFHVHDLIPWRIHPTFNIEGCLTYDGKALVWRDCIDHLKKKGGFRHSPSQTFFLSLLPHRPARNNEVFLDHLHPFQQYPYDRSFNITRVMMVVREPNGLLWTGKIVCLTVNAQKNLIETKDCVASYKANPNQWFEVIGETSGSNALSTVAMMRSVAARNLCISRGNEYEKDLRIYIRDDPLRLRKCDDFNPQTMYFEFELLRY